MILFKMHFKKIMTYTALTLAGLSFIVFLIQLVEVIRKGANKKVSFMLEMKLSLLTVPLTLELIFPIAMLIASLWTFWRIHTNREFTVLKAAGVPFFKFLTPFIAAILVLGAFKLLFLNPFAAYSKTLYENYSNKIYKDGVAMSIHADGKGAWMRFFNEKGYTLIRAHQIITEPFTLNHVTFMDFNKEGVLEKTLFAQSAALQKNHFVLKNGFISTPQNPLIPFDMQKEPTSLDEKDLQKAARPQNYIPISTLRKLISDGKSAGLSLLPYEIQLWNHYLSPLMMLVMLFFASTLLLSSTRKGSYLFSFFTIACVGIFLYLLNTYMMSLGTYGYLPVFLALLAPLLIAFCLWLAFILHMEHGL